MEYPSTSLLDFPAAGTVRNEFPLIHFVYGSPSEWPGRTNTVYVGWLVVLQSHGGPGVPAWLFLFQTRAGLLLLDCQGILSLDL